MKTTLRTDGRKNNEERPLEFSLDYTIHAEGSVLVSSGNTKIICTASVEIKFRIGFWIKTKNRITAGLLLNTECFRVQPEAAGREKPGK